MLQHSKPFHGQHELSALLNEGNNNNEPVVVEEAEETLVSIDTRPAAGTALKINPLTMLRQAFRRKQWDLVNFYLGRSFNITNTIFLAEKR
jgi:hypothetical protein